jgi:hypothetical protein
MMRQQALDRVQAERAPGQHAGEQRQAAVEPVQPLGAAQAGRP